MALRPTGIVAQESLAVGTRRQTGEGEHLLLSNSPLAAENGAASSGTTMFTGAHDLQIVNSTLTLVGGDIHNNTHFHYENKRDIWAILKTVPNFRDIYHDMLEKVTPGTGMWLVKRDKFRVWLDPNGDIKIFWGSGIPGAGKTVLASIVIGCLEALRNRSGAIVCICYVYFRYGQHEEVTVRNVLEIIVKQTLERHPECRALIENTYAQHLLEGSEPTVEQLLGLLRSLANRMVCTFYVLDALDEAPVKIQLSVVKTLASLSVKLFITSRPLRTVEAKFPEAHTTSISAQDADLDLHIAKAIDGSADLQYLLDQEGPSLKEEIISNIKQNCGGMFLHASLQLDALCECISAHQVRRTLKAFPSKIEDVYIYTWDRILKQNPEHVLLSKAVLVWVLYALRSMTVEELRRAVATSPHTHQFQADRVVPSATLISLCRGLITVDERSSLVRLVHYTAKDTLEALLRESFPHPHSLLATVCMAHLAECGFQNSTFRSEREFGITLNEDPLLAYASEAWAFHACAELHVPATKHQTAEFIKESHAFPAFTISGRWGLDIFTPLHIVGLYKLPMVLLDGTLIGSPNLTTKLLQQTPLIVASLSGHKELVVHLLALPETQVNLVDNQGLSALMRAAEAGQEDVVKLLLAHPGTQVNLVDHNGWPALKIAVYAGKQGIFKLLLASPGIQVNLRDIHGESVLVTAALAGEDGIVKLLLAHPGIQVNLRDFYGWSALMRAVYMRKQGIAKLILAHPGIEVNFKADNGWSALINAARTGQEGVVKLLLAHPGIQVNLVDHNGWSALIWATEKGREAIVKLLLAHPGIQVNLTDDKGLSALLVGVNKCRRGVVKLLLAFPGIQVNLVSHGGWSALMLAAYSGQEAMVALLLTHPGIKENLAHSQRLLALMWAGFAGHQAIVERLLARGAFDINTCDADGDTAIKMAAQYGHEPIVRLLLGIPNIDTTIRSTRDSHTATSVAEQNGHQGIVELLRDFEARKPAIASTPEICQLSLHGGTDEAEEGSDSGSEEVYYEAEEGTEEDASLGSLVSG